MKPARDWLGASGWRSRRLAGYAMLLLLAIGVVQVIASIVFYAAIDRQSIREDHARRVAEFLVVSDRLHHLDSTQTTRVMTTGHLDATVASKPHTVRSGTKSGIVEIQRHVLAWETALEGRQLFLDILPGRLGRQDLVGSMQLADGNWLNFRSTDISSGWPIALRASVMTLIITLASVGVGLLLLRKLTSPLTQLSVAADAITRGTTMSIEETGTTELRQLARSLNSLQARIADMASDQKRSFEAISHDLRTPVSRLMVASDLVSEDDIARIVASSAVEIEALLASLQAFLRAQHFEAELELVDLKAATADLLAGFDAPSTLSAPASASTLTFREPLLLSLRALVQNAVQYGSRADIMISQSASDWQIVIDDDGPGIPGVHFKDILDPFFRLDSARARDTAGFGLGIATAHRLLQRFGGRLEFANRSEGGLRVRVTVPSGADFASEHSA